MIKQKYTFYKNGVKHSRQVEEEYYQYGRRFYMVKNLDNPESEPSPALADDIDKFFLVKKGEVRKGKYTDQPFQKKRAKAGGF